MRRAAVIVVVLAALAGAASGQRRDPPTFETGYRPPPTFSRPEPRPWSTTMEYVDFAILAAAMGLGAFFAIKLRSRVGIAAVMIFSLAYFGFYRMGCLCPIGSIQNVAEALSGEVRVELDAEKIRQACSAVKPARGQLASGLSEREFRLRLPKAAELSAREEFRKRLSSFECRYIDDTADSFALGLTKNQWNRALLDEMGEVELLRTSPDAPAIRIKDIWRRETRLGALPWLVVGIFALPLVFALLFGRVFCGSVCPLGAVQDVVLVRPLRLPIWLEHALRLLAVAYLVFAVLLAATGTIYLICAYDPFIALFRIVPVGKWLRWGQQHVGFKAGAERFFSDVTGRWELLVLPVSFLVIAMFVGRPYCRFLCPYGVLLRPLSRLSWKHASITPDECVQCRLCEDACPFNAIDKPSPAHRPSRWDKKRLAVIMAIVPLLIAFGAWGGWLLAEPLARAHLKVRLKDRLEVEKYIRHAEVEAEKLPVRIGDRTVRVEKRELQLLAVCEDGRGRPLWRSTLLEPGKDRVVGPLDEKLIRAATARDGDRTRVVLLVTWNRSAGRSGIERLKSFFHVGLADGKLVRREDLSAQYDPSEAFARRKYFAGSSKAYRALSGQPAGGLKDQKLDEDVKAVTGDFRWGGLALGVFLSAVVGWCLVKLSVTRSQADYQANTAACVSCGRCFSYCPRERLRRKQRKEKEQE
ncbi:MAG: 4Fe-4S binding protein [Planctomycetota bacterium]